MTVGGPSRSEVVHKHLRRIAQLLGENIDTLIAQYHALVHGAKHMSMGSSTTPTIDAWKAAIFHRDTRGLSRSAVNEDTAVLTRCLSRAAAFSAYSSGCEHTFSVTAWMHEGRRGFISGELEEDELKLACDCNDDDDEMSS